MSESRPLANTLPQASAGSCPLFSASADVTANLRQAEARSWAPSTFGLGLVGLTLVEAVYRLGTRALLSIGEGLSAAQWALLLLSIVAFAYGEGYRALHRRFVPHLLERASELAHAPQSPRTWLLAPGFLLCLVQAERTEQQRAWLSLVLIAGAVLVVRRLPEPYRGIVDAGVAVALSIGLGSLLLGYVAVVRSRSQS
jgi:hypothetical protein